MSLCVCVVAKFAFVNKMTLLKVRRHSFVILDEFFDFFNFFYLSGFMRKTCMSLMSNQAITKIFASLPGANQADRFISTT